ncbi:hypothetical protein KDL01_10810 [Actinospica durhamensis]|uniref:Uncharacterized protein n=1 Tax=Actinospica durhamensis TaxID=1508375 RepID=A0A941IRB1_9ACTN|nr:hypothetical protein [Actinospica durhamensis]MBR7833758.1 hypothetical protein [Actinospica durhamensis]
MAIPALAGAGVVIALIAAPRGGGSTSVSSWTAIPTPLSASALSAAEQACQAKLAGEHWPISVSAMEGVLGERRGSLTAVMLRGADQYGMCVGDTADPIFVGVGTTGPFTPAQLLVLDGDPGKLNGSTPFRLVYGQAAASVHDVVIQTTDGLQVHASLVGGRYFAWWPSGADPASITGYAADGQILKTLSPTPTDATPAASREGRG